MDLVSKAENDWCAMSGGLKLQCIATVTFLCDAVDDHDDDDDDSGALKLLL